MLQKLFCIILALLLLLGSSGCGKKDISSDIPESKNAVPGENKSNLQMETIEDKFTMLLEVYDILSSPLGKPYCTKEYWGGEEIDILKADNDYLIGLRNFENQMHYLFYCKSKHSITEIDTLDKHVPWEDICFDKENQAILFSYPVVKEKKAAHGKIVYLIPDNSYTYTDPDVFYDAKLEDLFQIPKAGAQVEPDLDFQFLLQARHNLQSLYFTNLSVWEQFEQDNICILHKPEYDLIRFKNHMCFDCLSRTQGDVSAVVVLDTPDVPWEITRFQENESQLIFPSPSGKSRFWDIYEEADFPFTALIDVTFPNRIKKQNHPLWSSRQNMSYMIGIPACNCEWEAYHLWKSSRSFSLSFEAQENPICEFEPHCPEIYVDTAPDRTITVWIKNGVLSKETEQELFSIEIEGMRNFHIQKDVKRRYPRAHWSKGPEGNGTQIQFELAEDYQLFGEFGRHEDLGYKEAVLTFSIENESDIPKPHYTISNYQYSCPS